MLFGPGQPLDVARYYVIIPDGIGHGKSSKPSDGLRAHFPQYDYDDMVAAQHEVVEKGLGVDHLRLILGTSMGCMHSFVWGETYPDYMDALMPLACQAVAVAGRNRVWRKMVIEGIRNDPDWKGGDYTTEPRAAMEITADMLVLAGSAPLQMQKSYPTRDAADKYLEDYRANFAKTYDVSSAKRYRRPSRTPLPSSICGAWMRPRPTRSTSPPSRQRGSRAAAASSTSFRRSSPWTGTSGPVCTW